MTSPIPNQAAAMKVLVANRGEIAVRIMRACRELGFRSVAVYSESDRSAPHVGYADEAYLLGPSEPRLSYLSVERLIDVAKRAGADAVHPGYGFLAESEELATAVARAGLLFVGPSPEVIGLMGGKTAARAAARQAGVPVVPGSDGPLAEGLSDDELGRQAEAVGYPLFVKAVAGGGGKGMRAVATPEALAEAVRRARSEATTAFGDGAIYLERRIDRPRHIEVQVLGDQQGVVVPFVERECTIQRRHQKVVEESPSPAVGPALRTAMTRAAASLAQSVGYTGAGTVEFLVDPTGEFYFLEMNTRLQVEHPVTEMVTGVDLVHWQFKLAAGSPLTLDPERLLWPRGHAIECRVYAEDPDAGFLPCPGPIRGLRVPAGPGIRDDSGVAPGFEISTHYDPLLSKVIAWGEDRDQAIARMARAVAEYEVQGVRTTLPFFRWLLDTADFRSGRFDTGFIDAALAARDGERFDVASPAEEEVALLAVAAFAHLRADRAPPAKADSLWRRAGRVESLRG